MSRVTSLTNMPDAQLNRWIKRLALLFVVVLVAFVALYAFDRFRMPSAPMVDRQLAAAEEEVRQNPQDITVRLRLGALYQAAERWTDAVDQYDQVLTLSEGNRIAILGKGQSLYQLDDLDGATAAYQVLVDQTSGDQFSPVDTQLQEAQYFLGQIALKQSYAEKAIDAFTAALAINKSDADALYGLGSAYMMADQPEEAIEPLRKAILFVPMGWAEPYSALADAYTGMGKPAEAGWASAMAAFAAGQPVEARAQLEALATGAPTADIWIGIGLIGEQQGDLQAALDAYQKALVVDDASEAAAEGVARVKNLLGSASGAAHPPISTPLPSLDGTEG